MNSDGKNAAMGQRIVPYITVLLFSIWPFINFAYSNILEHYSISRLAGIAAVFAVIAQVGFAVFTRLFFRNQPAHAAAYASLLLLCLFGYSLISMAADLLFGEYHLRTWAGVALFILAAGYWLSKPRAVQAAAPFVGLAIVLVPAVQFALASGQGTGEEMTVASTELKDLDPRFGTIKKRRSVYFILHDAYPRDDVLKQLGHDNSSFIEAVESMGAYVAKDSHSNYDFTIQALGSIFFMKAPYTDTVSTRDAVVAERFSGTERGHTPVHEFFIRNGYFTALLASSARNCNPAIDICETRWSDWMGLGQLEANLLRLTPLTRLAKSLSFSNEYTYSNDILPFLDGMLEHHPVFLYAHIFDAHVPFSYNEKCEQSFRGKSNFDSFIYGPEYVLSIRCSNQNLLGFIKKIVENDPDSIMVIVADHGPDFNRWRSGKAVQQHTPASWYERYSSVGIWRLPEGCQELLYPSLTPINVFPVILACLTETKPELLPDTAYYPEHRADGSRQWKQVPIDLSRGADIDVSTKLREAGLMGNQ